MNAPDLRSVARLSLAVATVALWLGAAGGAAAPAVKSAPPKPMTLAAPKSLAAAVAAVEKATGSKAVDLELKGNPLPAEEGRAFRVEGRLATRLIDGSHDAFLKSGLYLFRMERSFGMGGGLDLVAIVKTTDRGELIRRVGTLDPSNRITTDEIADWLAALEKDEPFSLNEIGHDFVAGRFRKVPADPAAVARRCAEIAPELVKGSASAIDYLAEEIRGNRTLYLIW